MVDHSPLDGWPSPLDGIRSALGVAGAAGAAASTAVGFSARKDVATGSATEVITGWDTEDWDSGGLWDGTTGRFTPSDEGGSYWLGFSAFGDSGTPSGTDWGALMLVDGGGGGAFGGAISLNASSGHGTHGFHSAFVTVPASDTYYEFMQYQDIGQHCSVGGFKLTNDDFFFTFVNALSNRTLDVQRPTELLDPGSDYDPSTGVYTIPTDGLYLVTYGGRVTTSNDNTHGLNVAVNGVTEITTLQGDELTNFTNSVNTLFLLDLEAGDELTLVRNGGNDANRFFVSFGAARVTPTYSFAARKAAGSGSADDDISGFTEDFDNGSVFNATTGVFTAPADGQYLIFGKGNVASTGGVECSIEVHVEGSVYQKARHYNSNQSHDGPQRWGVIADLTAGDEVTLVQKVAAADNVLFGVISL